MNICFVTYGCVEKCSTLKRATGMANPLMESGHEVTILLEYTQQNVARIQLECPDVTVIYHQAEKNPFAERHCKVKAIQRNQFDLIWICGIGLRNHIFRWESKALVLGDHVELFSAIENRSNIRRLLDLMYEWLNLIGFDGQICASKYIFTLLSSRLKNSGLNSPLCYLPYAFNSSIIGKSKYIRHVDDSNLEQKKIVYMGSFWENYGFWDMLHAAQKLSRLRNDFNIIMMGKGPEKEAGIKWIKANRLGKWIKILGYVPEDQISKIFQGADAFICPLRDTIQDWARCPSKLFMYLPFMRPIITCPVGEAVEIFGPQYSYFYKPGDVYGLTKTISKVLNEPMSSVTYDDTLHTWHERSTEFEKWFNANKASFMKYSYSQCCVV